jgi:circadian clock protein KaiB
LASVTQPPACMSPFLLEPEYELYLFVAGANVKSLAAQRNIQAICGQYLSGRYSLQIIDVQQHPEQAVQEELLGLPCLVKKRPGLVRRLVGDLSDRPRVLKALGLSA